MLTPASFLAPIARRLGFNAEFNGSYGSWSDALAAAGGYDAPQILEKVHSSALRVKRGEAAFERDSVCFMQEEFRWPLLSCLLYMANARQTGLHVVDFGGSLGSLYFQHRKFLNKASGMMWSIVEQAEYVRVGRADFEDDTLKFFATLDNASARSGIDVTLYSGSLQYLEDPFAELQRAAALSAFVIVDRTPFIEAQQDRIAIQHARNSMYDGTYPHRFFSRQRFERFMMELGFTMFCEWDGFDKTDADCRYQGVAYQGPVRR
ncbi:hypothetical protein AWB80_05197 [Caballeronia pedi]|uniref:Methyltransferase, TIGR04325 family n=1 Tax=Caballeronia pedi TaxID=1777141 RepID=A0A158CGA6_9BURK|nr:methyltransferase, TIGR04325 family [Caballeronia pedi]SAK81332.1 hypothetical protein AWB80_05197 [Caballeronia pedi]